MPSLIAYKIMYSFTCLSLTQLSGALKPDMQADFYECCRMYPSLQLWSSGTGIVSLSGSMPIGLSVSHARSSLYIMKAFFISPLVSSR